MPALPIRAEYIRNVLRYVDRFQNAAAVVCIDDRIIASPFFSSLASDICLMRQAGIRVIIVPGARKRIDDVLEHDRVPWRMEGGRRVTGDDAMPLIKMAAFDVSNIVMTALAGEKRGAVIGNWVRARRRGVINGVDFGSAGAVDRIDIPAVRSVIESGFIPIFPCIGWSASGRPFNLSSLELAGEIAALFPADKLFLIAPGACYRAGDFSLPEGSGLTAHIADLPLEEARRILELNAPAQGTEKAELLSLLSCAAGACERGVERTHILDGNTDGVLLCEVFSEFGSGTMVYRSGYGGIRDMTLDDIPAVLAVMRPFIEGGILLPRTGEQLAQSYRDYIVFELDGGVRACAALHMYDDGQGEIAAVAVNEGYSRMGTGPRMIKFLIDRARGLGAEAVFVLTTQTADWFEQLGFVSAPLDSLPPKRRGLWNPARGSKIFRLPLGSRKT
ncbi:MAG: amino-acid N-acetyltransferase [Spirochaetaceae bacterium]|jgi:amino-acid N-acetyltransferase|nr:amino-acid N-acetyltransferase [Spirochaetaceae bacterium]